VSGLISSAVGSFDSVGDVIGESGNVNGAPPAVANTFSLQLNTQYFTTSLCNEANNKSACQGWQQFIYSNSGLVFMQYWLLNFGPSCPATGGGASGWLQTSLRPNDCYANSSATVVPVWTIPNPVLLSLTGTADAEGTDTVIMSTDSASFAATGQDSILNLAPAWKAAEFNIFGDCCSSQANFNNGATLVVRTSVNNGTTRAAPSCVSEGFTGETNNLTLASPCSVSGGVSPAIVFTENNGGSSPSPHQLAREPWLLLLM
jgi:hypothetical protein